MKTSERGYTPVLAGDGTEHSPSSSRMMEAVAVAVPSAKKEFVEVRAPSSLGPGYELTVNVNGGHWNVLVVRK